MDKMERRTFTTELRVEKGEDGSGSIEGHAAVFDLLSENLGGFREKIDKGAFDKVLKDDVRALIDHESRLILGRTKAGTLSIGVDEKGLTYKISPIGNRSYEKDLVESMERKEITQSSFAFEVDDDSWDEDDEGRVIRTIKSIKRLYDVSPVTFPAYPDTDVAKREFRKKFPKKSEKKSTEQKSEIIDNKELKTYLMPDGQKVSYRFETPCKRQIAITYVEAKQGDLFEDGWEYESELMKLELETLI